MPMVESSGAGFPGSVLGAPAVFMAQLKVSVMAREDAGSGRSYREGPTSDSDG